MVCINKAGLVTQISSGKIASYPGPTARAVGPGYEASGKRERTEFKG